MATGAEGYGFVQTLKCFAAALDKARWDPYLSVTADSDPPGVGVWETAMRSCPIAMGKSHVPIRLLHDQTA